MAQFQHYFLAGRAELLAAASQWNDLWQRSFARQPTVRAEGIAAWLEHFGNGRPLRALCIEQDKRLVAALPLVEDRYCGLFPLYKLPVNCWANAGDLLAARDADLGATFNAVADALSTLAPMLLSFDEITLAAPQWIEFQRAVEDQQGRCHVASESQVGVIDILGRWDDYEKSWSGNHRGAVKRTMRKLSKQGELRLKLHQGAGDELERLLRLAFEIEDRSWKGDAGTSVLKTPGMLEYMLREAQVVAAAGHVELWFLYLDDLPIAFEYCHFSNGTCFSHKIGYDPQFSNFGPGRLLRYLQLQAYHENPQCRLFDMLGTLCDSKAKWATRTYATGHLMATLGSRLSSTLLGCYASTAPRLRRWRGVPAIDPPKLGAKGYLESSDGVDQQLPVDAAASEGDATEPSAAMLAGLHD